MLIDAFMVASWMKGAADHGFVHGAACVWLFATLTLMLRDS